MLKYVIYYCLWYEVKILGIRLRSLGYQKMENRSISIDKTEHIKSQICK